jgi:hypothetical protein
MKGLGVGVLVEIGDGLGDALFELSRMSNVEFQKATMNDNEFLARLKVRDNIGHII